MVRELKRENKELQMVQSQYRSLKEHNEKVENENNVLKKQTADLNQKCDEYKSKLHALQIKYDVLYRDYNMTMSNYKNWDSDMITNWIISLSKDYEQYETKLREKLKEESIDGMCLVEVDMDDLHRFGIANYKHKKNILKDIQELKERGRRWTLIQQEGNDNTPFM